MVHPIKNRAGVALGLVISITVMCVHTTVIDIIRGALDTNANGSKTQCRPPLITETGISAMLKVPDGTFSWKWFKSLAQRSDLNLVRSTWSPK